VEASVNIEFLSYLSPDSSLQQKIGRDNYFLAFLFFDIALTLAYLEINATSRIVTDPYLGIEGVDVGSGTEYEV
jgi:hypothetical protein